MFALFYSIKYIFYPDTVGKSQWSTLTNEEKSNVEIICVEARDFGNTKLEETMADMDIDSDEATAPITKTVTKYAEWGGGTYKKQEAIYYFKFPFVTVPQ